MVLAALNMGQNTSKATPAMKSMYSILHFWYRVEMSQKKAHASAYRAITTINAPLSTHIDANTLVDCLLLQNRDPKWRPHIKSFFLDVNLDIIMDMVIEDSVSFNNLLECLNFWQLEESDNARWVREMVS